MDERLMQIREELFEIHVQLETAISRKDIQTINEKRNQLNRVKEKYYNLLNEERGMKR